MYRDELYSLVIDEVLHDFTEAYLHFIDRDYVYPETEQEFQEDVALRAQEARKYYLEEIMKRIRERHSETVH